MPHMNNCLPVIYFVNFYQITLNEITSHFLSSGYTLRQPQDRVGGYENDDIFEGVLIKFQEFLE